MRSRGSVAAFLGSLVLIATCVAAHAVSPAAPASTAAPAPVEWVKHDLIVDLRNLPKRYTCNDLWYRFRDVLVAIGARPLQILPYRCERALGSAARSPRVHLAFEMPRALPATARGAVVPTTIHIAAGHPQSLGVDDCDLLRQMKDTLFASLRLRVVDFSLNCQAPENARPRFGVSVQVLPAAVNPPIHAAAAEVEAHSKQLGGNAVPAAPR